MRAIALLSCLWVCSLHAGAATPSEHSGRTLEALEFMTGCWKGEGWIRHRSGVGKFESTELVEIKAGNTVLAITGRHLDSETGKLVHDAFAIVDRAKEGEGYRFTSFLATGESGEYSAQLEDGALIWTLSLPNGGTVRYTIRVIDGEWRETGHYSADGTHWQKTFGMTLKRADAVATCL